MNTKINYLGLPLKNPIIVGSCGLTNKLENLKKIEEYGAGAVVLKSLFEEQILLEVNKMGKIVADYGSYDNASFDYVKDHISSNEVEKYLQLIKDAKKEINIPIIGSINCYTYDKWIYFAKKIEDAGADALELNINFLPVNVNQSTDDVEKLFEDIISTLKKSVKIPIAIKCGYYFTDLAKFMQRISWMGIGGLTLFNRGFNPDIDVNKLEYKPASIFSDKDDLCNTLRWTAILSDVVRCDISASSGVQTGEDVVKLLLAGASSVQVVSCLYKHGIPYIKELKESVENWMETHEYETINQFKGKMSLKSVKNPNALLRVQFIKHYSGIE